ncbi:unnamed protein product [Calypogeia fissa]
MGQEAFQQKRQKTKQVEEQVCPSFLHPNSSLEKAQSFVFGGRIFLCVLLSSVYCARSLWPRLLPGMSIMLARAFSPSACRLRYFRHYSQLPDNLLSRTSGPVVNPCQAAGDGLKSHCVLRA